jgi:hypothetical protein
MANQFETSNKLVSQDYVTATSRYIFSDVGFYGPQKKITFAIYQRLIYTESPEDKYIAITAGLEYRPDLVSNFVYGTVDYWWVLLQANNIADVFDFKTGLTIRIPSSTILQQV